MVEFGVLCDGSWGVQFYLMFEFDLVCVFDYVIYYQCMSGFIGMLLEWIFVVYDVCYLIVVGVVMYLIVEMIVCYVVDFGYCVIVVVDVCVCVDCWQYDVLFELMCLIVGIFSVVELFGYVLYMEGI